MDHIERPIGKLLDTEINQFLPAPYCYVYVPKIITIDDCNNFINQTDKTWSKLSILSSFIEY